MLAPLKRPFLTALIAAVTLFSACTSFDDDERQLPQRRGSYLMVDAGGPQRLDAYIDSTYYTNWGQTQLSLGSVSQLSLYEDWLTVLDSANRRLALRELETGAAATLDLSSLSAPLTCLVAGPEYAVVADASNQLALIDRASRELTTRRLSLGFRPLVGVYSSGRFYVADLNRVAVIEASAFAWRDTLAIIPPLQSLDQVTVNSQGQIDLIGRFSGLLSRVTVDNLMLTVGAPTPQTGIVSIRITPYARRQFGRERIADVTLSPAGVPTPRLDEFALVAPDSVTSVGFDFFDNAAYYVVSGNRLVYDRLGLATGARILHTEPNLRIRSSAHSWRIPE